MKQFKDFGIAAPQPGFAGDKIKIQRILNREIAIHKYRIVPSKFQSAGDRLDLQIELNGQKHVTWCSAKGLIETIKQIPESEFPFKTTIIVDNERYLFT